MPRYRRGLTQPDKERHSCKRIGILGGIGPESTMRYYQHIVREYYRQYGNLHYPEILIFSVDYQDYAEYMCKERWNIIVAKATQALKSLQKAGAHFGLMACNTLHVVFDEIRARSPIPLISIVEATIESVEQHGMKTVGLLGTALTMNSDVYKKNLETRKIKTLLPLEEDKRFVDQVIRKELVPGVISPKSKGRFVRIIDGLASQGAEGVILGCTEMSLLVSQNECKIPVFDTTLIHAQKALAYSLTAGTMTSDKENRY